MIQSSIYQYLNLLPFTKREIKYSEKKLIYIWLNKPRPRDYVNSSPIVTGLLYVQEFMMDSLHESLFMRDSSVYIWYARILFFCKNNPSINMDRCRVWCFFPLLFRRIFVSSLINGESFLDWGRDNNFKIGPPRLGSGHIKRYARQCSNDCRFRAVCTAHRGCRYRVWRLVAAL